MGVKSIRAGLIRLFGLFPNKQREQELTDEMETNLQLHIDENLRRGMTPGGARREALLKFGGVESAKEAYRDRRSIPILENMRQDIRFALRQLRKNPGFSTTAIVMLALGIAATVSIFAFIDATLVKPLPYKDPTRLVALFETIPLCPQCPLSYPDFLDWRKLNTVFTSVELFEQNGLTLSQQTGAQQVPGARVTAGFFRTLGVVPIVGRDFTAVEDQPEASRTVLISYGAWQNRYGGQAEALGSTVMLNSAPHTIIGVLPPDFHFAMTGSTEFWTAFHSNQSCDARRGCHSIYGIARLKDGVTPDAALANVALIAKQLEAQYPDSNRGQGGTLMTLTEATIGHMRWILMILLGGAGLLLLIASVNVASLLLVRSESRRREFSVRAGLGASRARLVAQFITEGIVLVGFGALLGLLSAQWGMQLLKGMIPANVLAGMPYLQGLGWNPRVFAFAALVSLSAGIVFSVMPALRLAKIDLRAGLADGSRGSAGTVWRRMGSNLVVVELATAMVLLVGAGLLGQSLYRVLHVELGLDSNHLATLRVSAPDTSYDTNEKAVELGRRMMSDIGGVPGVTNVALTSTLPVQGGNTMWIRVVGQPYHGEHNEVTYREVTAGYFTTLKAKLVHGRYFSDAEDSSKPHVVVISEALAKKFFLGEDPIGKQIIYAPTSNDPPMEVVGVVADIREGGLDTETWPAIYVPFNQDPTSHFSVVVRTSQSETSVLPAIVRTIRQMDAGISTSDVRSLSSRINDSYSAYMRRCSAWLVGGFAAIALLLSIVGLYGVIAYSVSQRTREIGVRMALGAQPGTVYRLILREAGWLITIGVSLGLLCSIGAATLIRRMLYGVKEWDAPTLAAVAFVLAACGLLASYFPARRAASVNPIQALRAE